MAHSALKVLVISVGLLLLTSCGEDQSPSDRPGGSDDRSSQSGSVVRRVPTEFPTIQAAVDKSLPGDLVLIAAGRYHESVTVEVEDLVIRGEDRNAVVLDGGRELENGISVFADGSAVENLTVRGYNSNGVVFLASYPDELEGYRAAYLTVHDNGLYGVYAYGARGGVIEHIYASGHPDGGVYVGQCNPCNAVVTDLTAEYNAVGYLGTNSGGDLYVVESVFRNNRVGILPSSSRKEALAPGRGTVIAANRVEDNASSQTPRLTDAFGVGIAVGGAEDTLIVNNLVTGNPSAGILVSRNESFEPTGTQVRGNQLASNGVDLAVDTPGAVGSCFEGNTYQSSSPPEIEVVWSCGTTVGSGPIGSAIALSAPPGVSRSELPEPPKQKSMPNSARPAAKVLRLPQFPDTDKLEVPPSLG